MKKTTWWLLPISFTHNTASLEISGNPSHSLEACFLSSTWLNDLEWPQADIWSLNPLTDRHQTLPTWLRRGYLPSRKISSRSDKGFRFCACAISRIKLFTRLFVRFFWGSSNHLQPRRPHGFRRKIRQKTRFRARMCLLGVAKPKVKLFTPFYPQNRHFGARFRRDLKIFARKRL